jgi:hypothetical protein
VAVRNLLPFAAFLVLVSCGQSDPDQQNNSSDHTIPEPPPKAPTTGDIIFQISSSGQGAAIQFATHSQYSHCGLLISSESPKGTFVLEAVQPVRITPLEKWIKRGDGEHYVIKHLKNDSILTRIKGDQFIAAGKKYLGKDYDLYFGWGDDRIYCSELVWKLYKEVLGIDIGKLQRLKEFDLSNPIVQKKLQERYGDHIPYEEQVISPAAIFDSPLLKTIHEE